MLAGYKGLDFSLDLSLLNRCLFDSAGDSLEDFLDIIDLLVAESLTLLVGVECRHQLPDLFLYPLELLDSQLRLPAHLLLLLRYLILSTTHLIVVRGRGLLYLGLHLLELLNDPIIFSLNARFEVIKTLFHFLRVLNSFYFS